MADIDSGPPNQRTLLQIYMGMFFTPTPPSAMESTKLFFGVQQIQLASYS
jgi:hypothetical protein